MSNKKLSKKKEDTKDIDEALEKEGLEFVDDDEEEYDEDHKEHYQDEEDEEEQEQPPRMLNMSKISGTQKKVFESNNKKVLFLKALSLNCYQDWEALAQKCGLTMKSEGHSLVTVMLGMIGKTSKEKDFPSTILRYFNNLVPDGYPNKVVLEPKNINELVNLVNVVDEKLRNEAEVVDPETIFGPGPVTDAKTINPPYPQQKQEKVVMMDAQQQENVTPNQPYQRVETGSRVPIEGYQQQSNPESMELERFATKYDIPDVGLMEMALRRIPNPRPGSISPFINSFIDLYNDWMQNPMKMIEQLRYFFGPTHGSHAYHLWKDYREKYQKQLGYSPLQNEYLPYGSGYNNMGGFQPIQQTPDMMEDRDFDRKISKMMKMMEVKMMSSLMENQQPTPPGLYGQNYEEVLDPSGKVIKRIFLGNGHSNNGAANGAGELTMVTALTNIFKEMLSGANMEKIELMKKVNAPDTLMTDFTKTMMSNFMNQSNPVSQIKEMLEVTNMVKSANPQQEQAKSLEAIKMDIDSRIALQELDLRKMEMQHNWRMDENQSREADSNVDKWLNVFLQMGEGIIKPVAMKFVEGLGAGAKQNPIGAMFGGNQQVQQPNPYQQQAEAMAQQRAYQQQPPPQQYREPPLQPIPPIQRPPQHQTNYRPPPQQPAQPITNISEQQVQSELAQMTPEQIQEIEDKMALDDINREKIKNAILKHKNARHINRNQLSPQQQEAQQVLSNIPAAAAVAEEELDELEMDEDDFDDESDRFKPTSGVPQAQEEPAHKRKQQKDFREFAPESTTDITKRKKLTQQQKAMLASGQLSPRELERAPDIDPDSEQDEDEYSFQSIPVAGSPKDATREALIEENLKRQGIKRQGEEPKKSKPKAPKKKYEEEKAEAEKIVEQAEDILEEAELIPSDDNE